LGLSGEASVQNPGSLVSAGAQTINYTGFNKIYNISDTVGTDCYRLDFVYGPDQQRWKTTLKKNNIDTKTIIFAGDYEKVTANGITQELYYIGDKVLYVKQAGQPDKIYCLIKDHLGSIVKIVDNAGATVFAASYDAWGQQTVTNNTFAFHRGFTGHEHLPEFNLINMNGRVYDPILGRFLSPDPFVQSPLFSQNFNRYTYALNNPLIYTDPDGEYFFFFLIPNISWSPKGGFSIGLTAGVGIPGVFSAQVGVGYNFKNNDFNAFVGASAAFNTVYANYSTQSGWSSGWSAGLSPYMGFPVSTNFSSVGVNYNITNGSWSGNLSAWSVDKNGWTFNPSVSVMIFPEQTTNLVRGKGFRSNNQVLSRFVAKGDYQGALEYFGFEGKYNPDNELFKLPNAGDAIWDSDSKGTYYRDNAFQHGYKYLYAAYMEEKFHSIDYYIYKDEAPDWMKNETNKDLRETSLHYFEEWRAQKYLYKNQGLYGNKNLYGNENGWIQRINGYGINAGIYDMYTPLFTSKWWHFIYTLPRRW